jgi:hypothetical protein
VRAEQARIAARVALSTLSASVYFSDLAQAGAPEDTLEVVRGGAAVLSLRGRAADPRAAPVDELGGLHEIALRDQACPGLDAVARRHLEAILRELQQIDIALAALWDATMQASQS